MRRLHSLLGLGLLSLVTVGSSGCIINRTNNPGPTPATCSVPTFGNYTGNYLAFNIQPGAATQITAGDRAYAITSNGNGSYRVVWTDTVGYDTCFTGLITGIGNFSLAQVTGISGYETVQLKQPNQIAFASIPNAAVDGIDFFADQDPVYLDVFADGSSAVNIYYTDRNTGAVSVTDTNIAAFSSP